MHSSSRIWTQNFRLLGVLSQYPKTGLRFSKFVEKKLKIIKTSHLKNYEDLSSHMWKGGSQAHSINLTASN